MLLPVSLYSQSQGVASVHSFKSFMSFNNQTILFGYTSIAITSFDHVSGRVGKTKNQRSP